MASTPIMNGDPIAVVCPRCGYDLRGQLASAHAQLVGPLHPNPLPEGEGVCSECGLTFQWRDVTDPLRSGPSWCVEYEPSRRRLPLAAVKTWLRMLWPWGFWSRLQMHHEPRWRRIGVMYLFALIPFIVLYVVFQTSVAVYVRNKTDEQLELFRSRVPGYIASYLARLNGPKPAEFSQQQWVNETAFLQQRIAQMQPWTTSARPWSIDGSHFHVALRAVFTPLSNEPMAAIIYPSNVPPPPFASPRTMHARAAAMARTGMLYQWYRWTPLHALVALILPAGACLVFPLTLALLPSSLRRAKVRWHHIGRITAYSGMIVLAAAWLAAAIMVIGLFVPAFDGFMAIQLPRYAVVVPLLLAIVWWGSALGRYLRLPHCWAVACVHMVLAVLFAGGVFWYAVLLSQ